MGPSHKLDLTTSQTGIRDADNIPSVESLVLRMFLLGDEDHRAYSFTAQRLRLCFKLDIIIHIVMKLSDIERWSQSSK